MGDVEAEFLGIEALAPLLNHRQVLRDEDLTDLLDRIVELGDLCFQSNNLESRDELLIQFARLSPTCDHASWTYEILAEKWSFDRVCQEVSQCLGSTADHVVFGIIRAWAAGATHENPRSSEVSHLLSLVPLQSFAHATPEDLRSFLEHADHPKLAEHLDTAMQLVVVGLKSPKMSLFLLERCLNLTALLLEARRPESETLVETLVDTLFKPSAMTPEHVHMVNFILKEKRITGNSPLFDALVVKLATTTYELHPPLSILECNQWLDVFSDYVNLREAQIGKSMLQVIKASIGDEHRSTRDQDQLNKVLLRLMTNISVGEFGDEFHGLFLDCCTLVPVETTIRYIDACLGLSDSHRERAVECVHHYLSKGKSLGPFLLHMAKRSLSTEEVRLRNAIEFFDIVGNHQRQTLFLTVSPTARLFMNLFDAFNPQESRNRANMLVSTIRFITKKNVTSAEWLTPVEMELKSLCFAGRFQEAKSLATQHLQLLVNRVPATAFVDSFDHSESVEGDPFAFDQRRVLQMLYTGSRMSAGGTVAKPVARWAAAY